MKQLGIASYRKATGVKRIQLAYPSHFITRPKKPDAIPAWRVSASLDAHLRAWWAAARAARNLGCGGLLANFDYIGEDKDWPDMVHVGALAQAAGRSLHRPISKSEMGAWLAGMGVSKTSKSVSRKNHKGKIVYTTVRVFYILTPFRTR